MFPRRRLGSQRGRRHMPRRSTPPHRTSWPDPQPRSLVSDTPQDRQRSFHDIALRWLPDVTRFARSITRDETAAEDLVQETFLRAWRHWDSFKPGGEARAWLFTIARNAWHKSAPRAARMVTVEDDTLQALSEAEFPIGAPAEITRALTGIDLGPAIHAAIERLPEPFREVVQLVELQELSYAEAAEVLEIPVGTVRSRLFRARRVLQHALIEHARDAGLVPALPEQEIA
jgi:RNA polymerase sigma-70 factor, ECF subfamily